MSIISKISFVSFTWVMPDLLCHTGRYVGPQSAVCMQVAHPIALSCLSTRKQKILALDNSTRFKYPRAMWNYPLFPIDIVLTLQNE